MKELENVSLRWYSNGGIVKFDNRRLIIVPNKDGILLSFRRLIEPLEKECLNTIPDYIIKSAGSDLIGGKIVNTSINLSYEGTFLLAHVLMNYQREIRIRQIANTIFDENVKGDMVHLLSEMNNFMEISEAFELDEYDKIVEMINAFKNQKQSETENHE